MTPRRVVVTGRGVVSPAGIGVASHWAAVRAGHETVATVPRLAALGLPSTRAGEVLAEDLAPFLDRVPRKLLKLSNRTTTFALVAGVLAMDEAGLDSGAGDPDRFGAVVG